MKRLLILLTATSLLAGGGVSGAASVPSARSVEDAAPALKLRSTRYGRVLFDGRDRVLYAFTRDRRGARSTCYGGCARAWPVYFSRGAVAAMRGVRRSLIGRVRRRDGRFQVTYNGWPLYFYAHEGPREVRCQGVDEFGGLWLVVRADGRLVR